MNPLRTGRAWMTAAGWAGAAVVFALAVAPLRTGWPGDFYGFWAAGAYGDATGVKDIYTATGEQAVAAAARENAELAPTLIERRMRDHHRTLDLTATPFHYAAYRFLSSGDLSRDYERVRLICLGLYSAGIVALAAYLRFPPWSWPLLLFAFTFPWSPLRRDVIDQNGSSAVAGGAMLSLTLLRWRGPAARFIAGLAFGLLTAFKPTVAYAPFLIGVYLLLNDRRAALWFAAGVVTGAGAAVAASVAAFGPSVPWTSWLRHAPHRAFEVRKLAGGVLGRNLQVGSTTPYHIVTSAFLVACVGALLWISRGRGYRVTESSPLRPPFLDCVAAGAAGLNVYLLTGMLVWGHYFTMAVPSALIALRPRAHRPDNGWPIRLAGALAAGAAGYHWYFKRWGWTSAGNYSWITLGGTLALLLILLWDIRDNRDWRKMGASAA